MDAPRPVPVTPTSGCRWRPSRSPRARDARRNTRRGRGRRRPRRLDRGHASRPRRSQRGALRARGVSALQGRRVAGAGHDAAARAARACWSPSSAAASRSSTARRSTTRRPRSARSSTSCKGMPWPEWTYNVQRAEFDTILLDHARKQGVHVVQPATVHGVAFDAEGVTVEAEADGERVTHRARFLVDASGRDSFLAARVGQRTRVPNLGKVALFAYYRGADRFPGQEEGNIRLYLFDGGWFWWIPLVARRHQHRRGAARPDGARVRWLARGAVRAHGPALRQGARPCSARPSAPRRSIAPRTSRTPTRRWWAIGSWPWATPSPSWIRSSPAASSSPSAPASWPPKPILKAFADGRFAARRFAALRAPGVARRGAVLQVHQQVLRAGVPRSVPASPRTSSAW